MSPLEITTAYLAPSRGRHHNPISQLWRLPELSEQGLLEICSQILRLLLSDGSSFQDVSYQYNMVEYHVTCLGLPAREWLDVLQRYGFCLEEHVDVFTRISRDSSTNPRIIDEYSFWGVDITRSYSRDQNDWKSFLFVLLGSLFLFHIARTGSSPEPEPKNFVSNLASLVRLGADIYQIVTPPPGAFIEEIWFPDLYTPVITPTLYAITRGLEQHWRMILRSCGFDPAEVFAEDERRRREFQLRRGASSSAVEIEMDTAQQEERTIRRRIPKARVEGC